MNVMRIFACKGEKFYGESHGEEKDEEDVTIGAKSWKKAGKGESRVQETRPCPQTAKRGTDFRQKLKQMVSSIAIFQVCN